MKFAQDLLKKSPEKEIKTSFTNIVIQLIETANIPTLPLITQTIMSQTND
jgi:hypothetical protein